jgi:hypothetical protein
MDSLIWNGIERHRREDQDALPLDW